MIHFIYKFAIQQRNFIILFYSDSRDHSPATIAKPASVSHNGRCSGMTLTLNRILQ